MTFLIPEGMKVERKTKGTRKSIMLRSVHVPIAYCRCRIVDPSRRPRRVRQAYRKGLHASFARERRLATSSQIATKIIDYGEFAPQYRIIQPGRLSRKRRPAVDSSKS